MLPGPDLSAANRPILHTVGVVDADPDRDFQIQLARLEHALGRVADEAASPDDQVAAAEQAAQSASDADAALERLLRDAGGPR